MASKVVITGAGGGFGKLTVKSLLDAGHQVVGTMRAVNGRNKEKAAELTAMGAQIVEMDVTQTTSVEAGIKAASEQLGGLDVVINNAGVGVIGMQEHFTPEDWQKVFEVNVFGVQRVVRAAAPMMRAQQSGLLIYVSSLLGRMCMPFYGPYNASKFALEALAENYRIELSSFGVENAIVEPGGFETEFFANLIQPSDQGRAESYGEFMEAPAQMGQSFGAALAANQEQDPQKVADAITSLIDMPRGKKPFRTTVDYMGMGDQVVKLNEVQEQAMSGVFGAFGIGNLLNVGSQAPADSN
ncbi:SDR family oxidoreductase [Pontibacter sp. G13]|uniref:SDR family oxidoreductase n=1 Tax=Pontibacter sp. G13 TaxID=3074898 RepID=UPI00288B3204|nr:SDR family oxidoreductase [Pontibacter sp. G13]WNJ20711.1 SDR family oxidoreductase [Pontibacter sp. G13]